MAKRAVLIVDDDSSIRGLVRAVLRKENFDVDEANSGNEAITKLEARRYDAVVLDLMMGPGSGFDVLDTVKTQRPGEKFVVVLSAASQKTINNLEAENVCAKIRKPFNVDELLCAVRECVEH